MNKESIIQSIEFADKKVREYVQQYQLSAEHELVRDFLKMLDLLKEDLQNNGVIRERVLRGFKDICTTTAIQYEETPFNDPIFGINAKLEKNIPGYKHLPLLRMEFGKGDPI